MKKDNVFKLSIVALGIVFGDIGTSPLYAIKECFYGEYGISVNAENILGVLSLIFWALTIVVSIKYLVFVLNANNNGEGGKMANWRKKLYIRLANLAVDPIEYFKIPYERAIEIGVSLKL